MSNNKSSTTLFCFSPPIMLATFIVEWAMALYVLWKFRRDRFVWLVVTTLIMLGLFQLAEYNVCGGYGMSSETWSRIGFAAITTLPALGLHLLHIIAKRSDRRLVIAGYATMTAFIVFFLVAPEAFRAYECTGNYVIFQLQSTASHLYSLYYYGWLLTALLLGVRYARGLPGHKFQKRRQALHGLMAGYLVFLLPTTIVNSINPSTLSGIPSIMCGFAVIFALILTVYITPRIAQRTS